MDNERVEEWREVLDYPNYEVSNLGNVRRKKPYGYRILKPSTVNGYARINISDRGMKKNIGVHRLVAKAFLPNPNDYPIVNHKDENQFNNCVDNLEWCTYKYNSNHGSIAEKISKHRKKYKIQQLDRFGNLIQVFNSLADASAQTGFNSQCIYRCVTGYNKTHHGYTWKRVD